VACMRACVLYMCVHAYVSKGDVAFSHAGVHEKADHSDDTLICRSSYDDVLKQMKAGWAFV